MKKILILTSILSLAACGTSYHTGKVGMTAPSPDMQFTPQEAKISVSNSKVTGSAECSSFLWIFNSVPERQVYGAQLQTADGVMASGDCVAAAIYNAISKTDADIVVAPQYTTVKNGVLCFGTRCLFGTTKVLVKTYTGKIVSIDSMDRSVVQEKQKNNASSSGGSSMGFGLF